MPWIFDYPTTLTSEKSQVRTLLRPPGQRVCSAARSAHGEPSEEPYHSQESHAGFPLRRHQDAPATAGTEASRHRSGRAVRAGGAQAADHLKVGSCGKAAAWCSPRRSAPCSNSTTSGAASGRSPERSACATSEFPGAAAHVREHYVRGRRPSRGDRPVADHQQTRTTESVYRRELRPVITIGAEIRDQIFPS